MLMAERIAEERVLGQDVLVLMDLCRNEAEKIIVQWGWVTYIFPDKSVVVLPTK